MKTFNKSVGPARNENLFKKMSKKEGVIRKILHIQKNLLFLDFIPFPLLKKSSSTLIFVFSFKIHQFVHTTTMWCLLFVYQRFSSDKISLLPAEYWGSSIEIWSLSSPSCHLSARLRKKKKKKGVNIVLKKCKIQIL